MGIPEHSDWVRNLHSSVRFEWETGDAFVYVFREGTAEPVAMGVADFLALHHDAERICRRILSWQIRSSDSGNIIPLAQIGDWRAIPVEDGGH